MSDLTDDVKKIIAEQLGADADEIADGARFKEDLGADSLAIMEMVIALEEEFHLVIPDEVSDSILTVGDAIGYITRLKATDRSPETSAEG